MVFRLEQVARALDVAQDLVLLLLFLLEEALQVEPHADKVYGSGLVTGTVLLCHLYMPEPIAHCSLSSEEDSESRSFVDKYERAMRVVIVKADTDDD